MRIGIVIPSYNEEENAEMLCDKIFEAMESHDFELIFVNDGSEDNTGKILDEMAGKRKKFRVIHHKMNKGYGEAIKTGFDYCISKDFDAIMIMDGDLTHNPEDIPKFIEAFEKGADLVIGSRYLPGGGMVNVPPRRVFVSKVANLLLRIILGLEVKDVSSGFRGYRKDLLKKIPILSDSFQIHVELTTKAARSGYNLKEVPIILDNRRLGVSSFNLPKVAMKYVRLVINLRLQPNRHT